MALHQWCTAGHAHVHARRPTGSAVQRSIAASQRLAHHRQGDRQAVIRAAQARERADACRQQHRECAQQQVHHAQQAWPQCQEHEQGASSITELRHRTWAVRQDGGDLPQPHAEEPHRPLPRPQLFHRLAPACVSRRPRWQRAKGGQRDSAWHKSCAEGRVGGREIKISQNCSRWTDGVVNYCPPRKTGADRSSHKQQSLDRNHLRYPSPWSPHRPTVSQPPPPPPRGQYTQAVPGGSGGGST